MITQQKLELEAKLGELIEAHNVPGAQLAVIDGDEVVESAAGVLSLRTNTPATPDALFLPGSIGKLYTATLVLMLVGDGKLDLDTPIRPPRRARAARRPLRRRPDRGSSAARRASAARRRRASRSSQGVPTRRWYRREASRPASSLQRHGSDRTGRHARSKGVKTA